MIKEELVWADGRKLFPPRRASTVAYALSAAEQRLYDAVTDYVRDEMNRADRVADRDGDGRRRNVVGFALTTLQRRLASSPHAIHRSLERRRQRLEARVQDLRDASQGVSPGWLGVDLPDDLYFLEDPDDLDDLPEDELFELSEQVLDEATPSRRSKPRSLP